MSYRFFFPAISEQNGINSVPFIVIIEMENYPQTWEDVCEPIARNMNMEFGQVDVNCFKFYDTSGVIGLKVIGPTVTYTVGVPNGVNQLLACLPEFPVWKPVNRVGMFGTYAESN